MNRKLRAGLTTGLLVLLSSVLLFGSLNTMRTEYDRALAHLLDISRLNHQLDLAVLQIKTLDRTDYDDVAMLETRLSRTVARLDPDQADELLLQAKLQEKVGYIEDLKSKQAVFRNSLAVLPALSDALRKSTGLADGMLEAAVFRSVFATSKFTAQPINDALAAISDRPDFPAIAASREWRYISAHIDNLMQVVPDVQATFDRIQAVPIPAALSSVTQRVTRERDQQHVRSRISLYGLFALTILLLAVVVQKIIAIWRHGSLLEIKIRERTMDLENVNGELKREIEEKQLMQQELVQAQKLESIGQLSAGVAHEINTPTQYVSDNITFLKSSFGELMTVISEVARMAASEDTLDKDKLQTLLIGADLPFLEEEVPKAFRDSVQGIEYITKIVRALKCFSHQSEEKSPEDINRAIESTAAVARNEWKYVAELTIDADPNLRLVPCVLNEFNRVLVNLIVNAAHAIADVVGTSGTRGRITITTRQRKNHAEIRVADTGTGIPEDIRTRIFDPFFTTKAVGQGTGQGLAISYRIIVDNHGGTISVDSKPGEGSCFTLRLPSVATGESAGVMAA